MSKDREEELKQEVLEYRELKARGARITNKSAALDIRATTARLQDEVSFEHSLARNTYRDL